MNLRYYSKNLYFACSSFSLSLFFLMYSLFLVDNYARLHLLYIFTRNEPFVRLLVLITCVRMLIISFSFFLLLLCSFFFSFTNGGLMNVFFFFLSLCLFLKVYTYIFCLLLPSTLSSTKTNEEIRLLLSSFFFII